MRNQLQIINEINELLPESTWKGWWHSASALTCHKSLLEKLQATIMVFVDELGCVRQPVYFYCNLQMLFELELTRGTKHTQLLQFIACIQEELYQNLIEDVTLRTDIVAQLQQKGAVQPEMMQALDNVMLGLIDIYQQTVLSEKWIFAQSCIRPKQQLAFGHLSQKLLQRLQTSSCHRLNVMAKVLATHCPSNDNVR